MFNIVPGLLSGLLLMRHVLVLFFPSYNSKLSKFLVDFLYIKHRYVF